jgi:hypothetical protein
MERDAAFVVGMMTTWGLVVLGILDQKDFPVICLSVIAGTIMVVALRRS